MAPKKWVSVHFHKDNSFTTLNLQDKAFKESVICDKDGAIRMNYEGEWWEGSIVAEAGKLCHIKYRISKMCGIHDFIQIA
jgi:hypothetical protein